MELVQWDGSIPSPHYRVFGREYQMLQILKKSDELSYTTKIKKLNSEMNTQKKRSMTPLIYKEIMQLVYFIYSVILPGWEKCLRVRFPYRIISSKKKLNYLKSWRIMTVFFKH